MKQSTICAYFGMLLVLISTEAHAKKTGDSDGQGKVLVFAAVSLIEPLQKLTALYSRQDSSLIRYSYAASSTLARQIEAGAEADIYLSANQPWMTYLEQRSLLDSSSRQILLKNTLVIAAHENSDITPFTLSKTFHLSNLLAPGDRIALGDPDHVPAGIYAAEALEYIGQWAEVSTLLARADNTRAALALIERGEARFGFVYATDARASKRVKILSSVAEHYHHPINYEIALTKTGLDNRSKRFYRFLRSKAAQNVFAEFGFGIPPS